MPADAPFNRRKPPIRLFGGVWKHCRLIRLMTGLNPPPPPPSIHPLPSRQKWRRRAFAELCGMCKFRFFFPITHKLPIKKMYFCDFFLRPDLHPPSPPKSPSLINLPVATRGGKKKHPTTIIRTSTAPPFHEINQTPSSLHLLLHPHIRGGGSDARKGGGVHLFLNCCSLKMSKVSHHTVRKQDLQAF